MRNTSLRKKSLPRRDVSLVRTLSKLGYCSRSRASGLVTAGLVRVNGNVVTDPSFRCDPARDHITVRGNSTPPKRIIRIILNKPAGVVTTYNDEHGRPTVYDCIGSLGSWIFPVGRLDKDTEGLILMTNDNQLGNSLTDPASRIPKTYLVVLDKPLDEKDRLIPENGMMLDGEKLLPATIRRAAGNVLEVTICEGKNRQIRRMFKTLGYNVISLTRTAIGDYRLTGLKPGEWREISNLEIRKMLGKGKKRVSG